ncbi:hypothetical protein O0L34_g17873 [Tuta absoluta]|nr:hypothetical protein O0L34_g17873 [Tuta absoluta]
MTEKKYYKWKPEDLKNAIHDFKNENIGINECARLHKVPKATLKRHLQKGDTSENVEINKGRPVVFDKDLEDLLVKHIVTLEHHMFGLTISDIRKLAYQIAEKNYIPHRFNHAKQMAGKAWFYAFMQRHKDKISLRQPEATSLNRVKGFNRENIANFFDIYEEIVDKNKLTANKIFNVDESGFQTVQKKPQKVVGEKGKRQVGALTSGERGVNTTMVACASVTGQFIPPMIIFKRMRMNEQLKEGAPAGSLVKVSESGYINRELFVEWLEHFISVVKPTKEDKVLLLLDGHTTYSKNLEALSLARDKGVILLQLPGHTTHRLQPLDVSFFKPMSTYYTQAIESWMRANPGSAVTQYQVSRLINEAYERAATIGNVANGFRATGIWPVNRHVFQDHHFAAADALLAVQSSLQGAGSSQAVATLQATATSQDAEILETPATLQATASSQDAETLETPTVLQATATSQDAETLETPATLQATASSQDAETLETPTTLQATATSQAAETLENPATTQKADTSKAPGSCEMAGPSRVAATMTARPSTSQADQESKVERLKKSLNELSPLPKNIKTTKGRGAQKAVELTSSPYKRDLEKSQQKGKQPKTVSFNKNIKSLSGTDKKKTTNNLKMNKDKKFIPKKEKETISKTKQKNEPGVNKGTNPTKKSRSAKKKKLQEHIESSNESSDEEAIVLDDSDSCLSENSENECAKCKLNYWDKKGPKVDWVKCIRCHKWNHETCTANPDICDDCLS